MSDSWYEEPETEVFLYYIAGNWTLQISGNSRGGALIPRLSGVEALAAVKTSILRQIVDPTTLLVVIANAVRLPGTHTVADLLEGRIRLTDAGPLLPSWRPST